MLLFVSIQKKGIEVHIAAKPTDKSVIDPISSALLILDIVENLTWLVKGKDRTSALLILDIVENPQISPARVNADPAPRRDHPTVL